MNDIHPDRYPKHDDPDKGQVYGGLCNVTRCDNEHAIYWNVGTYGFYCPTCAAGINWHDANFKLCTEVPAKPSFAGMETLRRELGYYTANF